MVTGFTLLARCAGYIPGTTFRRMRRTSLLLLLCVTEDAIFQRQCVRVCLRHIGVSRLSELPTPNRAFANTADGQQSVAESGVVGAAH